MHGICLWAEEKEEIGADFHRSASGFRVIHCPGRRDTTPFIRCRSTLFHTAANRVTFTTFVCTETLQWTQSMMVMQ